MKTHEEVREEFKNEELDEEQYEAELVDDEDGEEVSMEDLKEGVKRSTQRVKERAKTLSLIQECYTTYREDETLDYLSDSLLYQVCKDWVETKSKFNFED